MGINLTHNAIKELGRKLAEKEKTNFEFFRITKNSVEFMNSENYMYAEEKFSNLIHLTKAYNIPQTF